MTKTKQEILDIIENVCNNMNTENFDSVLLCLKPQNSDKMLNFADAELHVMITMCEALFMYIYSEIKLQKSESSDLIKILFKINNILAKTMTTSAKRIFGENAMNVFADYVTQKAIELTNELQNELLTPDDITKH